MFKNKSVGEFIHAGLVVWVEGVKTNPRKRIAVVESFNKRTEFLKVIFLDTFEDHSFLGPHIKGITLATPVGLDMFLREISARENQDLARAELDVQRSLEALYNAEEILRQRKNTSTVAQYRRKEILTRFQQ